MKKTKTIPLEVQKERQKIWVEKYQYKLIEKLPLRIQTTLTTGDNFKRLKNVPCSYLYGAVGTGKSTEAAWMFLEWNRLQFINRKPTDCVFTTSADLLFRLKQTYSKNAIESEEEVLNYFRNVRLLVLDDFGVEKTTDWAYQLLYMILHYRYDNLKTTIYSSNLSLDNLAEKLGDDRIPSRIAHECKGNIIEFKMKSKRT